MQRGLVPNLFWNWIGPVVKPRDCFGERQRGAFGLRKIRRFAPGGDREQTVVCLARLLKFPRAHIDADATAIDLACAQVDEIKRAVGHTAFSHSRHKRQQRCIASGISIAGFFIRGCIVFIFLSLFLFSFLVIVGPQNLAAS
jgi:hypothetical protein